MLTTGEPTPEYEVAAESIARAAHETDGIDPLNEAARFALRVPGAAIHWLVVDEETPVAYAQWHRGDRSGIAVVHPEHRRRGIGRDLVDHMSGESGADLAVWAFGDLPAARHLAAEMGLRPVRGLHQMSRSLNDLSSPPVPPGLSVRAFTPEDLETVRRLNAAAFATHPEQGHLTLDDLRQRMAEPWFDPAGLLLAEQDGVVLGFHWTKRESAAVGEVYVLGVDPEASGRGIGKALLWAGLHHLRDIGCHEVELFVDADNEPAVELYERAGFAIVRTDVLYRPDQGDPNEQRGR